VDPAAEHVDARAEPVPLETEHPFSHPRKAGFKHTFAAHSHSSAGKRPGESMKSDGLDKIRFGT
jgi:hypothetical protein